MSVKEMVEEEDTIKDMIDIAVKIGISQLNETKSNAMEIINKTAKEFENIKNIMERSLKSMPKLKNILLTIPLHELVGDKSRFTVRISESNDYGVLHRVIDIDSDRSGYPHQRYSLPTGNYEYFLVVKKKKVDNDTPRPNMRDL